MRVTRPTMNLSTIASPMTRTFTVCTRETISRARSGASGGSSIVAAGSGEGKSDEHEEEHQKLGVAEVVFEETGRQHAGDGGKTSRRQCLVGRRSEDFEKTVGQHHDECDPDGQRWQTALGRDLKRDVVEVWVHRLHGVGI